MRVHHLAVLCYHCFAFFCSSAKKGGGKEQQRLQAFAEAMELDEAEEGEAKQQHEEKEAEQEQEEESDNPWWNRLLSLIAKADAASHSNELTKQLLSRMNATLSSRGAGGAGAAGDAAAAAAEGNGEDEKMDFSGAAQMLTQCRDVGGLRYLFTTQSKRLFSARAKARHSIVDVYTRETEPAAASSSSSSSSSARPALVETCGMCHALPGEEKAADLGPLCDICKVGSSPCLSCSLLKHFSSLSAGSSAARAISDGAVFFSRKKRRCRGRGGQGYVCSAGRGR